MSEASDRALKWDALLNARDLGGIPSAHGPIAKRAIVRSDALYRLNDAGRRALLDYGVRTVIDMRTPAEVTANPYIFDAETGVVQHSIPQQTDAMWQSLGGKADRVTFDVTMLELGRSRFARIATAIAEAPHGGVLIHCEVGKDRTGLMTMVLLDLVGAPADVIAADYALTAAGLTGLFAALIAKAETDERRKRLAEEALCRAEVMAAIHSAFRARYGDAEAYLKGGGASDAVVDAVRRRMLGASPAT
ncbi:MAG TPA: tyrosine-protein phosphatase [Candidatus Limnocylindrales bacterium]|nr:tyrosine-protein phosphatase [Candidatus Limnocylindrales bacterium]